MTTTTTTTATKRIKDYISKPSEALEAMAQGLERFPSEDWFRIDMNTYGCFDLTRNLCFGCAATCTVMQLMDRPLSGEQIDGIGKHALTYGLDDHDMWNFETTMNVARQGSLSGLFRYLDCPIPDGFNATKEWHLDNHDWREQLGAVRETIAELKALGC